MKSKLTFSGAQFSQKVVAYYRIHNEWLIQSFCKKNYFSLQLSPETRRVSQNQLHAVFLKKKIHTNNRKLKWFIFQHIQPAFHYNSSNHSTSFPKPSEKKNVFDCAKRNACSASFVTSPRENRRLLWVHFSIVTLECKKKP